MSTEMAQRYARTVEYGLKGLEGRLPPTDLPVAVDVSAALAALANLRARLE